MGDLRFESELAKRREFRIQAIQDSLESLKANNCDKFKEIIKEFKEYLGKDKFNLNDLYLNDLSKLEELLPVEENKVVDTSLNIAEHIAEYYYPTDLDVRRWK